ncbi:MAG: hypothetical protein M3Y24_10190 [Acidobacteriota bacterium]|nr:hypothetical protein [Acidobacteriota bacterium]
MNVSIYCTPALQANENVRFKRDTLLDRMTQRLAAKTGTKQMSGPRGNVIASDELVKALLKRDKANHYVVVAHPWHIQEIADHVRSFAREEVSAGRISFRQSIDWIGLNKNLPICDLWFTPLLNTSHVESPSLSSRLRSSVGGKPYPTVLLAHGLSQKPSFHDLWLRLILERSRPWDSNHMHERGR